MHRQGTERFRCAEGTGLDWLAPEWQGLDAFVTLPPQGSTASVLFSLQIKNIKQPTCSELQESLWVQLFFDNTG